jgi:hypothetical protein
MKWSWHSIKTGLLIAEKIAVIAGEHGLTIQGQNPAVIDAAAHAAASTVIAAVKNPRPVLVPPSTTGE